MFNKRLLRRALDLIILWIRNILIKKCIIFLFKKLIFDAIQNTVLLNVIKSIKFKSIIFFKVSYY
jgi:hypothetical protein